MAAGLLSCLPDEAAISNHSLQQTLIYFIEVMITGGRALAKTKVKLICMPTSNPYQSLSHEENVITVVIISCNHSYRVYMCH